MGVADGFIIIVGKTNEATVFSVAGKAARGNKSKNILTDSLLFVTLASHTSPYFLPYHHETPNSENVESMSATPAF